MSRWALKHCSGVFKCIIGRAHRFNIVVVVILSPVFLVLSLGTIVACWDWLLHLLPWLLIASLVVGTLTGGFLLARSSIVAAGKLPLLFCLQWRQSFIVNIHHLALLHQWFFGARLRHERSSRVHHIFLSIILRYEGWFGLFLNWLFLSFNFDFLCIGLAFFVNSDFELILVTARFPPTGAQSFICRSWMRFAKHARGCLLGHCQIAWL